MTTRTALLVQLACRHGQRRSYALELWSVLLQEQTEGIISDVNKDFLPCPFDN